MPQHLPPDGPTASPAACTFVRTHLDAFIDGELTQHDAHGVPLSQRVAAHLPACPSCDRVARQLGALRAAVRGVGARERATVRASEALRRRAAQILSSR